jgi:RNA polymerase sigma-70 factor, ECF subfamily
MTDHSPSQTENVRLHLLVLRCQAGDEQAFARLFDWFGRRTLAHLRSLIGDDGEDVQQEVWLAVYRGISTLDNPAAFRTWLFRTTRHRAIDFLRKRRRERELIEEAAVVAVAGSEPGEETSFAALDETVWENALARIPPLQRELLLLRYRDELSYAEIALVVGCPIGTVRTRLHHAKRRLQELLKRGHR